MFVCQVEISQTMVHVATLLVNVKRRSMNRVAPSWFHNASTYGHVVHKSRLDMFIRLQYIEFILVSKIDYGVHTRTLFFIIQ